MSGVIDDIGGVIDDVSKPFKSFFGVDTYEPSGSSADPRIAELSNILMEKIQGNKSSVASEQLKQGLAESTAATKSAISSATGVSPALRARMLMRAGEREGQQLVKSKAELRAKEQAMAENALSNLILGKKSADTQMEGVKLDAHLGSRKGRQELIQSFGDALSTAGKPSGDGGGGGAGGGIASLMAMI